VQVLPQGGLGIEARDPERLLAENSEEALYLIEPGGTGRRVVEVHLGVFEEPRLDVGRAVC
jgi:hypothetical protein